MDLEKKFDLLLDEMKNICSKIDDKFEKVDAKFEQIDKRFEQIDKRFEQIDKRFEQIDKRFEQIDEKLNSIDKNISDFKTSNQYEHVRIYNMLNCLNSAFLQLNDLVANNSFRISNLEKHFN